MIKAVLFLTKGCFSGLIILEVCKKQKIAKASIIKDEFSKGKLS